MTPPRRLPSRLSVALAVGLALPAPGCVWLRAVEVRAYRCYEGPIPPLEGPSLEKTEILRRELARERRLPPAARGFWAEGMPAFAFVENPGGSFLDMCAVELSARFKERLSARPLPYSREQVGLLRAVASLHVYEPTARDARFFDGIASLDDGAVGPYQPAPGEPREPPRPPAQLRMLATVCLAGALPDPRVAPAPPVDQRLLAPSRGLDVLASSPLARGMIEGDPRVRNSPLLASMAARRSAFLAPSLADPGLVEGDRALTAELSLALTAALARRFVARGGAGQADLDRIVAAAGRFPATRDDRARALDLTITALAALSDRRSFAQSDAHRLDRDPPDPDHLLVDLLPLRSPPPTPWNDGWSRERTLSLVGPEVRRARIAVVLAELDQARTPLARCLLTAEAERWALPEEADDLRDRLLAPVITGGVLTLGDDLTCRFQAALHLDVAAARRPLALVRLAIRTAPSGRPLNHVGAAGWTQGSACTGARIRPKPPRPVTLRDAGAREPLDAMLRAELSAVPEAAGDPEVRSYLEHQEDLVSASLRWSQEDPFVLTRALLVFHASAAPGASLAWGRKRLLDLAGQVEREVNDPSRCPFEQGLALALFALAEHAARFGVGGEVGALLQRIREAPVACNPARTGDIAEIALRILEVG